METTKHFYLCRDGKKIYKGKGKDYNDCLRKLHQVSSCSWDHALKYEGYSIDEK